MSNILGTIAQWDTRLVCRWSRPRWPSDSLPVWGKEIKSYRTRPTHHVGFPINTGIWVNHYDEVRSRIVYSIGCPCCNPNDLLPCCHFLPRDFAWDLGS